MWFATPEGDLHAYDKRHLFTLAGEGEVYQPGVDRVELTWRGWRILLQVCYDLRFPGFVRNHGALPYDLALYVANWPEPRRDAWRTLLKARAIENQCFVVGVNRSGNDANGHRYAGDSLVIDHAGETLACGCRRRRQPLRSSVRHAAARFCPWMAFRLASSVFKRRRSVWGALIQTCVQDFFHGPTLGELGHGHDSPK